MTSAMSTQQLQCEVKDGIGRIVLDRPRALNALSFDMLRSLHEQLAKWETNDKVAMVLTTSADDRAFCAGGDVKAVCLATTRNPTADARCVPTSYFREEYRLNYRIATYPKPYLSYIDGITMGDHLYKRREIIAGLEKSDRIVKPANFPASAAGRTWTTVTCCFRMNPTDDTRNGGGGKAATGVWAMEKYRHFLYGRE